MNRMSTLFSLLLVALFALGMSSCKEDDEAKPDPVAGTHWVVVGMADAPRDQAFPDKPTVVKSNLPKDLPVELMFALDFLWRLEFEFISDGKAVNIIDVPYAGALDGMFHFKYPVSYTYTETSVVLRGWEIDLKIFDEESAKIDSSTDWDDETKASLRQKLAGIKQLIGGLATITEKFTKDEGGMSFYFRSEGKYLISPRLAFSMMVGELPNNTLGETQVLFFEKKK